MAGQQQQQKQTLSELRREVRMALGAYATAYANFAYTVKAGPSSTEAFDTTAYGKALRAGIERAEDAVLDHLAAVKRR